MKFDHTIVIDAAIETVQAFLEDVPAVARCVPGVEETVEAGEGTYDGKVRVRLGPLGFTLAGRAHVERAADGAWRLQGEGRDGRVGAGASAALEARLRALSPAQTEVIVSADVQFSGRLAQLGQPLIRRKAEAMVQEFAENLKQVFA